MGEETILMQSTLDELNEWMRFDSASSTGAVLLKLKEFQKIILEADIIVFKGDGIKIIIDSEEEFCLFVNNSLHNGSYLLDQL